MSDKLKLLNKVMSDEFMDIDQINYKSELADAVVLTKNELDKLVQERIIDEIPFLDNHLLIPYLPEKFKNEIILDDYKELCKYEHGKGDNMLYSLITLHSDRELFLLNTLEELIKEDDGIANLILSDSKIVYSDDEYSIFVSEIEIN